MAIDKQLIETTYKKIKRFDIPAFIVLILVLVVVQLQFWPASRPDAGNEAIFNVIMAYWATYSVYVASFIVAAMGAYASSKSSVATGATRDKVVTASVSNKTVMKRFFWVYLSPLAAFLLLIPVVASGILVDNTNSLGDLIGINIFVFVMATLLSPLIAFFVVTPVVLIFKGVIAFITGDTARSGYFYIGLFMAGILAFIIFGSIAVSPDLPYPVGSVEVAFALLGIPGGYEIKSEGALWITRAIAAAYIVFFIYVAKSSRKHKKTIS